jgi:hypothetical protein
MRLAALQFAYGAKNPSSMPCLSEYSYSGWCHVLAAGIGFAELKRVGLAVMAHVRSTGLANSCSASCTTAICAVVNFGWGVADFNKVSKSPMTRSALATSAAHAIGEARATA